MTQDVRHIFFDVGDTLRITHKKPEHQLAAMRRAVEILGADYSPEDFGEMIMERYEEYRSWATKCWVELNEQDLWRKFLAPEYPQELVEENAVELTFLLRQFKGLRYVADNAMEVVQELTKRGYKLGIISNVITSRELPDWLEEDGFAPYFSPVVLSSLTGIRKPDPRIFQIALDEAKIDPVYCAYIGDNVERDMGGAAKVGFGMKILIDHKRAVDRSSFTPDTTPDAIIESCLDLLDIFPEYPQVDPKSHAFS
ncbi:HAD family hydrolase [Eubacteriales bacterium OttesenSCG-928-K08]|nr:HAD family hydrolase [Eubacteriales bacterium OttesenSCG-928-K08]